MRWAIVLLCVFLYINNTIIAQGYTGQIVDNETFKGVSYANIGIFLTEIGLVTDSVGNFTINIPNKYKEDVLQISNIGYSDTTILVSELTPDKRIIIPLRKIRYNIDEVTITPGKFRYKRLGKHLEGARWKFKLYSDSTSMHGSLAGLELGRTFKNNNKCILKDLNYRFYSSEKSDSILFRINVYRIENNKIKNIVGSEMKNWKQTIDSVDNCYYTYPDEFNNDAYNSGLVNILKSPILFYAKSCEYFKTYTVNLIPYNIYIEGDFLISIEVLNNKPPFQIWYRSRRGDNGYIKWFTKTPWAKIDHHISPAFNVGIMVIK